MNQKKRKRADELMALRDKDLRERCLAIVARSGGKIEISDILRVALEEKLPEIEGADELQWRVRLDPAPAIERLGYEAKLEASKGVAKVRKENAS